MNQWYQGVMEALQVMEEIGGPELEEYIKTMEEIRKDVAKRVINAKVQQLTNHISRENSRCLNTCKTCKQGGSCRD